MPKDHIWIRCLRNTLCFVLATLFPGVLLAQAVADLYSTKQSIRAVEIISSIRMVHTGSLQTTTTKTATLSIPSPSSHEKSDN